jgi:hypothetical protein
MIPDHVGAPLCVGRCKPAARLQALRCYAGRVLRSVTVAAVVFLGLASCATGGDGDEEDLTEPVEAGGRPDASLGDAGADSGSPIDTGAPEEAAAVDGSSGNDAKAMEAGTESDTGGSKDAVADTSPMDTGSTTCAGHGKSGGLVTFDLTAQPGNEVSAPATSAVGVIGGGLSRAAALTAELGSGSINSTGWTTGATASASDYYTFTVTPGAGCTVTLTSIAIDAKASSTGPAKGNVATSADAFGTHTASFAGTSTPTVTLTGVGGTGAIELRVYGFGAKDSTGTFRIENTLTLSGSID